MALVFNPVLPSTTTLLNVRVKAHPPKHYKISYFRTTKTKCSISSDNLNVTASNLISISDFDQNSLLKQTHEVVTPETLRRDHFPDDFLWGAGTSAIQIEGDGTEGGRGPSTGDYLIKREEGGKGVNSYYMYQDDVKLLKNMNMPCYRFSISWSRILPEGTLDNINPEGIEYYNKLLDELEANNITPMATLVHFDMPQALQDKYNGFLDRRIIEDFTNYCDLCFRTFGKRIKKWITINEASTFILFTDCLLTDEQKRDGYSQFLCSHHLLLLAHASAYRLYERVYKPDQQGEVGMTIVTKGYEPHSESPEDIAAKETAFDFHMGCYFDPLCNGDYPQQLKDWVRDLPKFSEEEKQMLRQSFDFLGVNYYFGLYVESRQTGLILLQDGKTHLERDLVERFERDGVPIGPVAPGVYPIFIYPTGLQKLLYTLRDRYNNPKIYITETGCSSMPNITMSVPEALESGNTIELFSEFNDDQRLGFLRDHLHVVYQAMQDNVNIHGFISWSLMDNNEFGSYNVRFGLNYVDYYDNWRRYPKKTAKWYKSFLNQVGIIINPPEPETEKTSEPVTASESPLVNVN